ncbi:putative sterigmatocystin biosynthesis monooxygenase stcF [Glarea lozoyensis 74030]|uniref:Putative sterigmatocystin biosynthesis monooxygenase stcF n=1 Tax=Glarea lozoyensis (strain ATCC 74030 / MF5533) TaxID=1104152 RepID=H0ERE5_GLAL7|nr:putative sterigmatocystin biosynthesis monooxygenase stcF [Glarea lozoyensis 74030]
MITGTWTSFGDVDRSQLVRILIAGLTGIVTTSIVYSIWQAIYNVYFHPLSRFPGPKSWAASRFPREKAMVSGRIHYVLKDLHNQYGDVVRTGRDEISFTSAAAFKDIHTRYGPWKTAFPKDPDLYVVPASGHHSILSVKNDADHSRYRRLLSHAFSEKSLQEQAPLIKTYIDLFISRLHSNASKGPQDMVKWFNFTTFDIIGDLSLGESFECLEKQEYHPWIEFLFKAFKTVSILTSFKRFPWFNKVFMWMLPRSLREARTRNMMFTREKVLKRIKEGTGRPDFMTNVLKHNDKETGMSVNEIVSTFGLLILAGSETTATLLSAATYLILKHPEVLDKMVAEVRSTFKTEDEITQVSVNKLTYQIAVLEESLRVHPPAPFGFPRIVPGEKGQFVAGQWVPKGLVWFGPS